MNTIPPINEQTIRTFVGEQNFQHGLTYFRRGAISSPVKQGMTLKACCQGSQPTDYRVQVTFDAGGITGARCSSSTDAHMVKGYYCKHVAALLLVWNKQPEQFSELPDVATTLERSSKSELITLIQQILQQQPDLEWLITPLPAGNRPRMLVDPQTYQRQVDTAFRNGGRDWHAPARISDELYKIKDIGDEFAEKQDYANAVTVYEAVAMGVLENYNYYDDENGDLGRVAEDCVEQLDYCMAGDQDAGVEPEVREKILRTLFAIYRFSIDQGVSVTSGEDDVPELLLSYVTPAERRTMIGWVHEALQQDAQRRTDYERQKYGQFLLKLEKHLDDETFLQICRETGRIYDAVEHLLKLKRVDEAEREAAQASDYDLPKIADLFVQYKHDAAIEIYQQHVERLIGQREWGSYRMACEYLAKIRKLYEKLGEGEAWTSYIADLRKRYNRLRSLKAEMEEAGLLG